MAYSTGNLPFRITPGPIGAAVSTAMINYGGALWGYVSSDALATVTGSSYFSDGYSLGLRKYDHILMMDTNSTLSSIVTVTLQTSSGNDPRGCTVTSLLTS